MHGPRYELQGVNHELHFLSPPHPGKTAFSENIKSGEIWKFCLYPSLSLGRPTTDYYKWRSLHLHFGTSGENIVKMSSNKAEWTKSFSEIQHKEWDNMPKHNMLKLSWSPIFIHPNTCWGCLTMIHCSYECLSPLFGKSWEIIKFEVLSQFATETKKKPCSVQLSATL